jgi:hypothetical protein
LAAVTTTSSSIEGFTFTIFILKARRRRLVQLVHN